MQVHGRKWAWALLCLSVGSQGFSGGREKQEPLSWPTSHTWSLLTQLMRACAEEHEEQRCVSKPERLTVCLARGRSSEITRLLARALGGHTNGSELVALNLFCVFVYALNKSQARNRWANSRAALALSAGCWRCPGLTAQCDGDEGQKLPD